MNLCRLIFTGTPRGSAFTARVVPLAWILGLAFATSAPGRAQVATLDTFDSGSASGSTLAGTSWVGQVTRNATSITVGGTARDDNGWGASGQNINASSMTSVSITAQRDSGNVAPAVVIALYDATLKAHTISVSSSAFAIGTATTVAVPIGTWPTGFDPTRITDWNIGGGTAPTGLTAFQMTFFNLSLTGPLAPVAPTITAQPADRAVGIGTGTTMTVAANANNSGSLRYQWKKSATPIAGATLATLSLADTALSDSGLYQVDVSNDAGTTASRQATLTVLDARPTHGLAPGNTGYGAGENITLSNTIVYSGATQLRWSVTLPEGAGWSFVSDNATTAATRPTAGVQSLIEWSWTTVPTSPFTFTYTLNVPIGTTGDAVLAALVEFTQAGVAGIIIAKPDPLIVHSVLSRHAADTDGDFALNLIELTRVIELYNTRHGTARTGAYDRATVATEDGFVGAPDRADVPATLTRYHSADSSRDGRIGLVELTRVIAL